MLENLYKQIVMDHYKNPRNRGKLDTTGGAFSLPYKNPTCGDVVVLYMNVDESGRIADIKFEGEGCSISMASCSMMTELVKGKTVEQAKELIGHFNDMIRQGVIPEDEDLLGDALALSGVHKLRARHNCSLLGWQGLEKAIKQSVAAE
ncbi:Fe-S cluster assembly sulfur transfer protein SufU [Paenibacillus thermoaerophilus]|uniref:Fe-S cluster assembly sulfur transfer protein SufU n=1 Tax=Paenibacillus thermoaerophilus TaxID=1215385 RepID=A0ABW2V853_9BACL|nr:SUF system NifU family Fe-S cluster assembly protein [Paenibacillus thermoaerophilus]